jgi:hypothetical protein
MHTTLALRGRGWSIGDHRAPALQRCRFCDLWKIAAAAQDRPDHDESDRGAGNSGR